MKVISLWQPWASLIAWGEKTIETRSWPTNYRGPIAIHAAKKKTQEITEICLGNDFIWRALRKHTGYERRDDVFWGKLPRGGIVAVANLTDCFRVHEWRHIPQTPERPGGTRLIVTGKGLVSEGTWQTCVDISAAETSFGDFSKGRYGWVLSDVRPVSPMIPLVGHQGLFDAPEELLAELEERGRGTLGL